MVAGACVSNIRAINHIIVKCQFLILHLDDLQDMFEGPKLFTKIDLHSEYNLIHI